MKISLARSYKKINKKGALITMFVYMVTGTEQELIDYKEAQAEHYREDDDKNPLWFHSEFVGTTGKLLITSKGKCVPDTSEFDQAASLSRQYGGNLGQALANAFASRLAGLPMMAAPVEPVSQPANDKID